MSPSSRLLRLSSSSISSSSSSLFLPGICFCNGLATVRQVVPSTSVVITAVAKTRAAAKAALVKTQPAEKKHEASVMKSQGKGEAKKANGGAMEGLLKGTRKEKEKEKENENEKENEKEKEKEKERKKKSASGEEASVSNVERGAEYEQQVVSILESWRFDVKRTGRAGDEGVDFRGYWRITDEKAGGTPTNGSSALAIPVVGQCKLIKTRVGPKYVRELEGTVSHETSAGGVLGLLATRLGFTPAALEQFRASSYPMILATIVPAGSSSPRSAATPTISSSSKAASRAAEMPAAALPIPKLFTTFAQSLAVRITLKGNVKTYTLLSTGEVIEAPAHKRRILASFRTAAVTLAMDSTASPVSTQGTASGPSPFGGQESHSGEQRHEVWPVQGFVVNEAAQKMVPKLLIGSRKEEDRDLPMAFYDGQLLSQALTLQGLTSLP